jgi:hypothetical protein
MTAGELIEVALGELLVEVVLGRFGTKGLYEAL